MRARARRIVLASLVVQVLGVGGCYNCAVSLRGAMTECQVVKSARADFAPGSKLVIRDCDGAIKIAADDVTDCRVTATAFVHAPTKREAREIAEQFQIAAEPNDGTLVIAVKKPPMPRKHHFVCVDLDILIPRQAHVNCATEFGRIALTGIDGDVKAATQFGSVVCEKTRGSLDLETQWGHVVAREIVSNHLAASSQKGSIDISCADSCPAQMMADVSTEWGDIRFKAPPRYTGNVELESELGSVKLETPADVRGTMENSLLHDKVSGRIGPGEGSLRLLTNLGSVRLR